MHTFYVGESECVINRVVAPIILDGECAIELHEQGGNNHKNPDSQNCIVKLISKLDKS
jgi:hypothetical protein